MISVPEYSHLQFLDPFRVLLCCRPLMIGFSVEENMHMVKDMVDEILFGPEGQRFLDSCPEEIRAFVAWEWGLSLASSFLKELITERLREFEQTSHVFQENKAGNVFNDYDARLFPG